MLGAPGCSPVSTPLNPPLQAGIQGFISYSVPCVAIGQSALLALVVL